MTATAAAISEAPHISAAAKGKPIVVRKMGFSFDELSTYWLANDRFLTHVLNGLHFVFPAGERFFIRSSRAFYKELPQELKDDLAAFFGQEAQHQKEHLTAFGAIEAQGFNVQGFLDWYEQKAYRELEPKTSPKLRLAATAALEHYTATLGAFALRSGLLEHADPIMRDLFMWHAAEEVEHKAVTYDLLQHVDDRYLLRVQGFVMASILLFYFWGAGARHMLKQDQAVATSENRSGFVKLVKILGVRQIGSFVKEWADYLRPGFHPDQHDTYHLARDYFTKIGRLEH